MIDTLNQYISIITLGVIIVLTPLLRAIFQRIGVSMLVAYLALGFILRSIGQYWPILRTSSRMRYFQGWCWSLPQPPSRALSSCARY